MASIAYLISKRNQGFKFFTSKWIFVICAHLNVHEQPLQSFVYFVSRSLSVIWTRNRLCFTMKPSSATSFKTVYGRTFWIREGLRHERKNFVLLNLSRQHSRDSMQLSSTEPLAGHSTAHLEPEGKFGNSSQTLRDEYQDFLDCTHSHTHIVDSISVSCTT